MSGVILSKKYGVNPSLSQCLICGKDVGVILFGAAWKGKDGFPGEAPRRCGPMDPEPCAECRKKYLEDGDGVLLAEAKMVERPHHNPSRRWNGEKESFHQITGECAVIKRAAFEEVFPSFPVPSRRIAFVEPGVLARILPNPETEGKEAKS
jgi:hypothetical protein